MWAKQGALLKARFLVTIYLAVIQTHIQVSANKIQRAMLNVPYGNGVHVLHDCVSMHPLPSQT